MKHFLNVNAKLNMHKNVYKNTKTTSIAKLPEKC